MITTVAAAVCALALGLFFNWLLKRRRHIEPGGEPITTSDLTSPMETLAVLLLAFVLVVAAESYSAADEAVRSEAVVVEHLFEFDRGVALHRGLHHRGLRRPVRRGDAPVRRHG